MGWLYLQAGCVITEYPIISIEDPFEQDDWDHTKKLTDLAICQVRVLDCHAILGFI